MVATIFDRGVIRATGPDVAAYLQGQISQDLSTIGVADSAWSLVLQPSGKLTAWFRIHRLADDEFLIDVEPDSVAPTVARLERFKLRTDAEFVVESGWRMLSVRGADDLTAEGVRAPVEWPGFSGHDVLAHDFPTVDPGRLDVGGFEEARIRAVVPRSGVDIDDDTIPGEGGAPLIEMSVSFTKGCYTGQELVARIDSRGGNVPRPLRLIEADAELQVGAPVRFDGAEVGTVTSAQGPVALARVLRKVAPGSAVDVDGIPATIAGP